MKTSNQQSMPRRSCRKAIRKAQTTASQRVILSYPDGRGREALKALHRPMTIELPDANASQTWRRAAQKHMNTHDMKSKRTHREAGAEAPEAERIETSHDMEKRKVHQHHRFLNIWFRRRANTRLNTLIGSASWKMDVFS